jgi:hypothetical protein
MPPEINIDKRPSGTVLVIFVISVVLAVYIIAAKLNHFFPFSRGADSSQPANRELLSQRNKDFATGERLIKENPAEAIVAYERSLKSADSQSDIDSISFRIALATYDSGETGRGVSLFKDIIASSSVSAVTKAYALQFMTQEYFGTNSSELFAEIFTGEPYSTFLQEANGSKSTALRNLVEYGESFSSLPILTLRVADYKAKDLISLEKSGNSDTEKVNNLLNEIDDRIKLADVGIEKLHGSPNISLLPGIYNRKGLLLARLYRAGHSMGDPAEAYMKGISYAKLYNDPGTEMFINLNYSIFLSLEKEKLDTDYIKQLLKGIYENPNQKLKILSYLKNQGALSNPDADIVRLAGIDASFKSFLVGLDWKL